MHQQASTSEGQNDARDSAIRIHQRTPRLQYSRCARVQLVISVQEEQCVEGLLQDGVRAVVLLAEVVHLVEEAGGRGEHENG